MTTPKQVDYIIVGQGLAGSALAVQLLRRKKKILVIDESIENTSSKVAAGLFNPVTGRYVKKTWMADKLFPYLHNFYRNVEAETGQLFFFPMPLYCPFLSAEEQNEWMAKSAEPAYAKYIEKVFTKSSVHGVHDIHGGLMLKQGGYLETKLYIMAVKSWINKHDFFWEENFSFDELETGNGYIEYKKCKAHKIIFCQGEQALQNKWFNWVPVIPLKGETLTIETLAPLQQIINRGVYIVPTEKNKLIVGSTYNFDDSERAITQKAKTELEVKLHELVDFSYRVVEQKWGMRPTTPDRRPLLGMHPENDSIAIFNGLGTKGASIAPYFSEALIDWIENKIDLNKEVNVNRYKSLYSKFTK